MSLVDTGEDELDYGEEEAVVDRDTPISALVEDEMPQEDEDENEEEEEEEEEGYGDLYDDIDISSFEDPSHPSASKAVAVGGFSFEEEGRGSSKVGGVGTTGPALGTSRFDGKPVGAGGVPDLPTSVSCAAVSMSGDGRGVSPPPSGDHARPKKEAVPEITQFPSVQPEDEEEQPAAAAMVDVSSSAMDPKKSSSEEAIKRGNGGSGGSIGGGVGVYTIAQVEPPAEPVRSSYEQTLPSSRAPYAGFVKNIDSVTTLSPQEAVKAPNRAIQGGGGGVQKDPPPKYVGQSQTGDGGGGGGGGGSTMLFVGDLHWWTTDAELEAALSEYGQVKNLKFFEERASGKSKGYCQVEVYDPAAAAACKEGMNGKLFNGRPCVVAFATPRSIQQMGTAQSNKAQGGGQQGPPQHRRTANNNDGGSGGGGRANDGTHNNNNNNYGKSGSGSGFGSSNRGGYGQSSGGKGGQSGFGRGRGNTGGSKGGSSGGRGSYNQGHPGLMGPHGHPSGMMMPQGMMGQGYESAYGPPSMGRGNAGYGGYIMPGTPFSGMLPPFPSMGPGGLPGVAPHINPAFFGRSAAANGMGVLPTVGMEGPHHGMWGGGGGGGGGGDSNMGGWGGGDNSERRSREESYGEDGGGSEYGYGGDGGHEKGQGRGATRERADGDWTERRRRDDRDGDWDNRDRHWDRERDRGRDDDRDRERPTRGRNKQWPAQDEKDEEDSLPPPRSRGGDGEDYKRRRLGSDR